MGSEMCIRDSSLSRIATATSQVIIPPVQSAIAACSLLAAFAGPKVPISNTVDKISADIFF